MDSSIASVDEALDGSVPQLQVPKPPSKSKKFAESAVLRATVTDELVANFGMLNPDLRAPAIQNSPAELRRLIVFGPRLFSFACRGVCSLRHPRTSFLVWEKRIAWGKQAHEAESRSRKLLAVDPLNEALLRAEEHRWHQLATVNDSVVSRSPAAMRDRERLLEHVPTKSAIQRLWQRATGNEAQTGVMTQQQYYVFETRLYKHLFDPAALLDSLDAIEKDFLVDVDAAGPDFGGGVNFDTFASSVLEVADNWTATTAPEEYAALLFDVLVQVFAPDWSADADAAFQLYLQRRVVVASGAVAMNAAEARKGHRVYVDSKDADAAKNVMNQAVAEAEAAIAQAVAAIKNPRVSSVSSARRRPPAPKRPTVESAPDQRLSRDKPELPPLTRESLTNNDRFYAHRENVLPRAVRTARAQLKVKLDRAQPAPLFVAVPSKLMQLSTGPNAKEKATALALVRRAQEGRHDV
jgi:hypothetical protein